MAPTPPPSAVVRQQKEHGSLREQAARLKKSASSPTASDDDWLRGLRRAVVAFAEALRRHFEAEERAGAFEELIHRRPDLVGKMRQLQDEHGELRTGFEVLCAGLGEAASAEHARELLGLIERFESHEADENQLLLSAWGDDLGVGD